MCIAFLRFALIFFCLMQSAVGESVDDLIAEYDGIQDKNNYQPFAYFRFLDRVNDRVTKIKVRVNGKLNYIEKLQFKVCKCWKSPAYAEDESAALVEVYGRQIYGKKKKIFSGWLFSNNSFLTNIQHRRYDLKLLGCSK